MRLVSEPRIVMRSSRRFASSSQRKIFLYRTTVAGNLHLTRFAHFALIPGIQRIAPRGHTADLVLAVGRGHRKILMAEHQNERAHVRVNFAKHADDAGTIEAYRFG